MRYIELEVINPKTELKKVIGKNKFFRKIKKQNTKNL